MFKKSIFNIKLSLIFGILALDSAFFMLTNPSRVSSPLLMLGFVLFTATVYLVFDGLRHISQFYGVSLGNRSQRFAIFSTIVVAGIVALQSAGELTLRDLLVVGPLSIIMYLYLSYGRNKNRTPANSAGAT